MDRRQQGDVPFWRKRGRWMFPPEHFVSRTPSRSAGMTQTHEEHTLQMLCTFIQDLGLKVGVTQLCINTACVYLRRFFVYVDLKRFHRHDVATMCLFLAAKVEEQPRKLDHVITAKVKLLKQVGPSSKYSNVTDPKQRDQLEIQQCSEDYKVMENVILKVLGFDFTIDHPHTHVVRSCQLLKEVKEERGENEGKLPDTSDLPKWVLEVLGWRAKLKHPTSKDFAQTAYFLATNSLHLTNMCVMYDSATVAAICIFLASKWARYTIPQSIEGKDWYEYISNDLTMEEITRLAEELMKTFEKCPERLKRNFGSGKQPADRDEPDQKRRRPDNAPGMSSSSSQPVPGPSGVSTSHSQPVPGTSGESSASLQQHKEWTQRLSSHHRPGMSRSSAEPVSVKLESGTAPVSSMSLRVSALLPATLATSRTVTQPTCAYNPSVVANIKTESVASTIRMEPAVSQMKMEPGTLRQEHREMLMDPQDKQRLHTSASYPTLPALAEGAKKSQKLSLQAYQQRVEQRPHPVKADRIHPKPAHSEEANAFPAKKEKAMASDVMKLKEAKVVVQDLKDSHGKDHVMYTNAEASRKRSLSQRDDELEQMLKQMDYEQELSTSPEDRKKKKVSRRHSYGKSPPAAISNAAVEPAKTSTVMKSDSLEIAGVDRTHGVRKATGERTEPVRSAAADKTEPIKLLFRRDAGKYSQVKPEPVPSHSSPLKMKIRRDPETTKMHTAEVAPGGQKDLKLRLPVSVANSSHRDRHSPAKATSQGRHTNGEHDRRRKLKHGSHSHSQLPSDQLMQHSRQTAGEKPALHRASASTSRVTAPPPSKDVVFGSAQPIFQRQPNTESRPNPPLRGFSFGDTFMSQTLPDMIFEDDESPEVNGGSFDAPETPTPESMNRVNLQMQHYYAQTKGQQQTLNLNYTVPPPPHLAHHPMMVHSMNRSAMPPLPPPLPSNPPPPPPPPPQ